MRLIDNIKKIWYILCISFVLFTTLMTVFFSLTLGIGLIVDNYSFDSDTILTMFFILVFGCLFISVVIARKVVMCIEQIYHWSDKYEKLKVISDKK